MKRIFILYFIMLFANSFALPQVCEDDLCGYWYTENNEAIVRISNIGNNIFNGKFCWLLEPNEPDSTKQNFGEQKIDITTGQPLIKSIILSDTRYAGNNKWKGKIYDPRHGTTYKCNISLSEKSDIMIIKGYIGISLIGKRVIWTRTSSCK